MWEGGKVGEPLTGFYKITKHLLHKHYPTPLLCPTFNSPSCSISPLHHTLPRLSLLRKQNPKMENFISGALSVIRNAAALEADEEEDVTCLEFPAAKSTARGTIVDEVRRVKAMVAECRARGRSQPHWDTTTLRSHLVDAEEALEDLFASWFDLALDSSAMRLKIASISEAIQHSLICLDFDQPTASPAPHHVAYASLLSEQAEVDYLRDAAFFAKHRLAVVAEKNAILNALVLYCAPPIGETAGAAAVKLFTSLGSSTFNTERLATALHINPTITAEWVASVLGFSLTSPGRPRFTIVKMGRGYYGVVFDNIPAVSSFIERGGGVVSTDSTAWRVLPVGSDVFFRAATSSDELPRFEVVHSDYTVIDAVPKVVGAECDTPVQREEDEEVVSFKAPVRYVAVETSLSPSPPPPVEEEEVVVEERSGGVGGGGGNVGKRSSSRRSTVQNVQWQKWARIQEEDNAEQRPSKRRRHG